MTAADPQALLELALATAREAGELVVRLRSEGVEVAGTKSSPIDIVTEADRACEVLVRERLLGARPDDGMVGEEGSARESASGVVWIVDPIDGTVNYLYGLPHFAVSIAAEQDGEVVAGVVLAPVLGLEYVARAGGGATLNGQPIRPRPVVPLAERLVGTGFSYEQPARARQAGYLARMLPRIRDIRRLLCAGHLRRGRGPARRLRRGGRPHLGPRRGRAGRGRGGRHPRGDPVAGRKTAPDLRTGGRFRRVPGRRRRRRVRAGRGPERGIERGDCGRGIAGRHLLFMRHGAPGDAVRTGMVHNLAR